MGLKRERRDREKHARLTEHMTDQSDQMGEDLADEQLALQAERQQINDLLSPTLTKQVLAAVSDEQWRVIRQQAEPYELPNPDELMQQSTAYTLTRQASKELGDKYMKWAQAADHSLATLGGKEEEAKTMRVPGEFDTMSTLISGRQT
ncbi:unnamed protein product [Prorocentrum cordatum]|uniref:Uncharacterized protein n=1 Tax=Prorocentrum cordatum TaxID=2364126 RepID=A0ABN9RG93_9DINO|nr:unnamed protein product [Polarella glacialis]